MSVTDARWQSFLTDYGTQCALTKRELEIFKYQFDLQNEHLSGAEISRTIQTDKGINNENYLANVGRVYNRFGDQFNIKFYNERGTRSDTLWRWLKQEYPKWEDKILGLSSLSVNALWEKLKELGKYSPERMGIYIAKGEPGMASALPRSYQPKAFLQSVSQETEELKFKVLSEKKGDLLLLNYDETSVYCLCPSEFAPSAYLNQNEMRIPQPESPYAYLGTQPGKEEWWAWLVHRLPPISWLEDAHKTALQLNSEQLAELLSQVSLHDGEVIHTFYRVS